MTYPSGRVITYNYTNDRAVSVLNNAANLATNIAYKPFGGMSSITYGNGLNGSISYDNQYRVSGIAAGTVMNLSYNQYDANGNIKSIQNILDPTKNKSYDYDSLDRLVAAADPWGSLGWTYDGVGNRQTQTSGGTSTYAYQAGTNKLSGITGAGSSTFTFDLNGNTASENAKVYTYNQNQRLIQVNDGAMTANYTYNGNGQRAKKVVNGLMTVFHYSLKGHIIAESNSAGNVTVEYVYLNGQPLAKIDSSGVNYIHNDHLSTPFVLTDALGSKVWEIETRPFGDGALITGSATLNLRFPGQYYDGETGTHYNYFRDYNPVIGRYVQSDFIGIQRGQNHLYVYSGNAPLNNSDFLGLFSSPINININLPTLRTNPLRYYRSLGPDSCGPCERRTIISARIGYADLIYSEDITNLGIILHLPIMVGQEITWGCVPNCCKELPDFANIGRRPGTFPIAAWRVALVSLLYDLYIETYVSKFDCSGCNNQCKACG